MAMLLPKTKTQKQVGDLKIGEFGFVVPWAMWARLDGKCYMNKTYAVYTAPAGEVRLKVECAESGYIVYINEIEYQWAKSETHGFLTIEEDMDYFGEVISFGKRSYESLSEVELEEERQRAIDSSDFELAAKIRDIIWVRFHRDQEK